MKAPFNINLAPSSLQILKDDREAEPIRATRRDAGLFNLLLQDLETSREPLRDFSIFHKWVMVRTSEWCFAPHFCGANLRDEESLDPGTSSWLGWPAAQAAKRLLNSENPTNRSLGLACLKASFPVPTDATEHDCFALLEPLAARTRVLMIGMAPQAWRWMERGWNVSLLEPGPTGEVTWPEGPAANSAELVISSGSILLGGWLRDLVRHTPRAKVRILTGPTVPPSPILFRTGIHGLGLSTVSDPGALSDFFRHGGADLRCAPLGSLRKFFWIQPGSFLAEFLKR